ncbi:MAG: hypothetical protein ACI9SI_001030 [Polaribacter sp.]|jgi:hypothetical protein
MNYIHKKSHHNCDGFFVGVFIGVFFKTDTESTFQ